MTQSELLEVIQSFKDLLVGKPVNEKWLNLMQNIICSGYYFTNYMISQQDRDNVFAASAETLHEAFGTLSKNMAIYGCTSIFGTIIDDTVVKSTEE